MDCNGISEKDKALTIGCGHAVSSAYWRVGRHFEDAERECRAGRANPAPPRMSPCMAAARRDRWRCYLDDEEDLVFYCPVCAAREFDSD
jgi:hypothetical protein